MQDSFDARIHGDVPASVKHKSNIGWIIVVGILLAGLVALVVMQVLAYQEIARKDNEISELKNKPAATQAEVKEPTEAEVATDKISVDLNGLKEQMIIDTGVPKDKFVFDVSHQCYPHKMLTGRKEGFLAPENYLKYTDGMDGEMLTSMAAESLKKVILDTAAEHGQLPAEYMNCQITWKSSDETIITAEGRINAPAEKTKVELTAVIQSGETVLERTYKVTVKP